MLLVERHYSKGTPEIVRLCTKSKESSFFDNDLLPKYGDDKVEFSGKRKYRGLYVSKDGFAVNADVNGSLNIGRKVIGESVRIVDRSLAARPRVINPLKNITV